MGNVTFLPCTPTCNRNKLCKECPVNLINIRNLLGDETIEIKKRVLMNANFL